MNKLISSYCLTAESIVNRTPCCFDYRQIISVDKYDEVAGMLGFANDIISHISQVETVLKKEKKKRLRREQIKNDNDKLQERA